MSKYYFLVTLLPPLSFDETPEITFAELDELLHENLSKHDYAKTAIIRRYYDLINLRALWLSDSFDLFGTLSADEIEEAAFIGHGLPRYVHDFLEQYDKNADRLRHFPSLLAHFFRSNNLSDPFLKAYLKFEREVRLILTAFRAQKLQADLILELQYENPEEEFIAQLLAQKDAPEYEPPEEYRELKIIFSKYNGDPLHLQRAIDEYRLEKIDSFASISDTFSIERILAYLIKLIVIEKWVTLNRQKGLQIIETIVKEGS